MLPMMLQLHTLVQMNALPWGMTSSQHLYLQGYKTRSDIAQ
jgi:hypothetical protein